MPVKLTNYMFTHYLITRFNIRVSDRGPEHMHSPEMDLKWLTERLHLFLQYCVPSVLEQVNKNFTWLIYLDRHTPVSILKQINFLNESEVSTEIIFIDDYDNLVQDLVRKIKQANSPYVITSRLDNDDSISRSFINDIQRAFRPLNGMIINFPKGYEYNIQQRVFTKWNRRFKNQFMSLIESCDADDVQSVYGFPHWKVPPTSSIVNIEQKPNWIYLGHHLNYSNLPITGIPLFVKPGELKLFPQAIRQAPISISNTLKYTLTWLPRVMKRRWKNTK